jgi:hypothetical protein
MKSTQIIKTIVLGAVTLGLYAFLFANEEKILAATSQGKWSFFIPLGIAFVFSFAHGAFTAEFWDVLGVKAKK